MDEKDFQIIEILKKDSSLSTQSISAETKIPVTTVHNRIKKMKEKGVIKGYTIKLDHSKMGRGITAFVHIQLSYEELRKYKFKPYQVLHEIRSLSFVEDANMVTGDIDMIIKIRGESIEKISAFIARSLRSIKGIRNSRTMVVLPQVK